MSVKINKIDAARRQIETAIDLTFQDGDVVSIHSLAAAANEILGDLCEKAGLKGKIDQTWEDHIKPECKKDFEAHIRKHANFFKHADRDPHDVIELFQEDVNDFNLTWCIDRWTSLGHSHTSTMSVFMAWYVSCNHRFVKREFDGYAKMEAYGRVLQTLPRATRTMMGRAILAQSRGNAKEHHRLLLELSDILPTNVSREVNAITARF